MKLLAATSYCGSRCYCAIIDGTKKFQNKVKTNVDKGKQVIKKSVAQLDQYKETKKKI